MSKRFFEKPMQQSPKKLSYYESPTSNEPKTLSFNIFKIYNKHSVILYKGIPAIYSGISKKQNVSSLEDATLIFSKHRVKILSYICNLLRSFSFCDLWISLMEKLDLSTPLL